MGTEGQWIGAAVAVAAGLGTGAAVGLFVRRWLSKPERRPALRAIAVPSSVFVFWLATAAGIIFAIGFTSPDTLRPIPRDVIDWLPNVLIAGLLILAGYAAGIAVGSAVGRALSRATGQIHTAAETVIRWVIVSGAIVLALAQLGVRTTVITVIIGGIVFGAAMTFALLAGLGGRTVASHIAVSRTLRAELEVGSRLTVGDVTGVIVDAGPTTVTISTRDNRRVHVAYGLLLEQPFETQPPSS